MALVVEDYEPNLSTFTIALELQGWSVRQARSLQDAFTKLASGPVHLLLTEIVLRDGDGFQLAQRVRSKNPAVACIFIADDSVEYIRERYSPDQFALLDSPRATVLVKPFGARVLREAVQRVTTEASICGSYPKSAITVRRAAAVEHSSDRWLR